MKNFINKHPVIVLLTAITICEGAVRCTKLLTKKKKNKKEQ